MHSHYEAVRMKSNNHYLSKFVILDLKTKDLSLIKQNEIKKMLDFSQSKIYDVQFYHRELNKTRTPKSYER